VDWFQGLNLKFGNYHPSQCDFGGEDSNLPQPKSTSNQIKPHSYYKVQQEIVCLTRANVVKKFWQSITAKGVC
jgi:hypothetical protein